MRSLVCFLILAALSVARPAHADKEKAKELFKKGMTSYKLDKYDEAITAFEQAYAEEPSPVFLFNIAQSHRLAKRPKQALDFYKKYLKDAPTAPNRAQVEEQIASLQTELKKLEEDEARRKDEEAAAARAAASAAAAAAATQQTPPPAQTDTPKKRWPLWVGIAVGAAAVVAGGVTAGVLLSQPGVPSLGLEDLR